MSLPTSANAAHSSAANTPEPVPPFNPVELTPEQQRKWEDTRSAVIWNSPMFAHVWYEMMSSSTGDLALFTNDSENCPIAATDGKTLMLNPETFFKRDLYERTFIVNHEILHNIFDHCGIGHSLAQSGKVPVGKKSLPYDHGTMNVAMDLIINDMLVNARVGRMPKNPDGTNYGHHDPSLVTEQDGCFDAYGKVWKKSPKTKHNSFDKHAAPGSGTGQNPHTAQGNRSASAWAAAVAAGMSAARAQGKLPANIDRALGQVVEPKVSWQDHIKGLLTRKTGSTGYDWRKPNRQLIVRDIYYPSNSGFGAGTVVVAADTSGSIQAPEIDMFMAEVSGILEDIKPKQLFLLWCDAQLQRVDECTDPDDLNHIRTKGAPGGGGTDFVPVFEWVEQQGLSPDALVYLTDGMGRFPPKPPKYPVIWGNIYKGSHYPFGDVVDIPRDVV